MFLTYQVTSFPVTGEQLAKPDPDLSGQAIHIAAKLEEAKNPARHPVQALLADVTRPPGELEPAVHPEQGVVEVPKYPGELKEKKIQGQETKSKSVQDQERMSKQYTYQDIAFPEESHLTVPVEQV